MHNLFSDAGLAQAKARVRTLTPYTEPEWGQMDVAQMLAHCCVAYEMEYTDKHPRPGLIDRFFIRLIARRQVIGDKPYTRGGRTGPTFVIVGARDFYQQQQRLLTYLDRTHALGAAYFEKRDNPGFGKLSANEWNTLFAKHLEHHLTQFGV